MLGVLVPAVDVTAAEMLARLREELDRRGVRFVIARDIGQVRDVLRRAEGDELADGTVFPTVGEAVAAVR
jgi:sulfate permease, SulP family